MYTLFSKRCGNNNGRALQTLDDCKNVDAYPCSTRFRVEIITVFIQMVVHVRIYVYKITYRGPSCYIYVLYTTEVYMCTTHSFLSIQDEPIRRVTRVRCSFSAVNRIVTECQKFKHYIHHNRDHVSERICRALGPIPRKMYTIGI